MGLFDGVLGGLVGGGMASVITLMPDCSFVTSTLMPPLPPAPRGSSPGRSARPHPDPPAKT